MKIYLVYLVINSPLNYAYNHGVGYISAFLKKNGYQDVTIFSIKNEEEANNLLEKINEEKPDVIGFSVTTPQFGYLKLVMDHLRTYSDSYVVCGGVHPTFSPRQVLDVPGVNCVIRGEGEYAMKELVDALKNKEDYLSIKNCCFKIEDNYIENPIRPLIENLDELPFPDKDNVTAFDLTYGHNGMRFIFSRGCPYECTYCSNKAMSQLYPNSNKYTRFRSVQKSIEEIQLAIQKYNIDFITFDDDLFSLNKKWYYDFLNEYKLYFKIPFRCNLRVGTVDEDMIKLLKEAGASNVGVGIEQGNEKFRTEVLKRNMSNKQIIETFKLLDKYKISHFDFVMVGMPHENRKLFLDTIRLCRKIRANSYPAIFYPYSYTELGKECVENNWVTEKEFYVERREALTNLPEFSKKDIELCQRTYPALMRYRWLPLWIPLEIVQPIDNIINSVKIINRYYMNKIFKRSKKNNSQL